MLNSEQPAPATQHPLAAFALRFGFTGIVLGLFAAVTPFQGCKAGVGASCRCATDCRNGLTCQVAGKAPLNRDACASGNGDGCCYPAETPGQCGEMMGSDDSDGMVTMPGPDDNFDASKRDLAMPDDGESDGGSSGSTGAQTTGTQTTAMTTAASATTNATTDATTDAATTNATTDASTTNATDTSSSSTSSSSDASTGSSSTTDTDTDTDTN